jgi:GTPase SAR1 family protein
MNYIALLGTAGSGKSYMTASLSAWLEDHGFSVVRVNLDPAAEWMPYSPDVDARDYVSARKLMEEKGMGPNGAVVASVDMLASHVDVLAGEIRASEADFAVLDTPGQMELFAFRATGPLILKTLVGGDRGTGLFLIDPAFTAKASHMLSALLLYYSVRARIGLPQVPVISKADLLDEETLEELREMMEDPVLFESKLLEEGVEPGLLAIARGLYEAYGGEALAGLVEASSRTSMGIEAVYAAVQQALGGIEEAGLEEEEA